MFNVTEVINSIDQPKNGYVPTSLFETYEYDDGISLNPNENIPPNIIGIVVDYLTRFVSGAKLQKAFSIPLKGAELVNDEVTANKLLDSITGLNDESVISACKLIKYDVCYRTGNLAKYSTEDINTPDKDTIENIITMVNRGKKLWNIHGDVVLNGITFPKAKSYLISNADADYLTKDTLWDFKVSKYEPTTKHTLQLLMYYLLGISSTHVEFATVTKLGVFNPRLNKAYILNIADINPDVIAHVYSKEMLMDVIEVAALKRIENLKEEKLRVNAFRKVSKGKPELDYETYIYAVWHEGKLIEKVPKAFVDEMMCTFAFTEMRFDYIFDDNNSFNRSFYGMFNDDDLLKYIKYIPDQMWETNFANRFFDCYRGIDVFNSIPKKYQTDKLAAKIVGIENQNLLDKTLLTPIFYKECARLYPSKFEMIPKEHISKEAYENAVAEISTKSILKCIPKEIQDYQFFVGVVNLNGLALRIVPNKFLDSDLCYAAIKQDAFSIKHVPKNVLTEELCKAAISQKASAIRLIPHDISCFGELCQYAVEVDWKMIKFIPKECITQTIKDIAMAQSKVAEKYL